MNTAFKFALVQVVQLLCVLLYATALWLAAAFLLPHQFVSFRVGLCLVVIVRLLFGAPEAGGTGYWSRLLMSLAQAATRAAVAVAFAAVLYLIGYKL